MAPARRGYGLVINLRLELPPALTSAREARIAVGDTLTEHHYGGDVDAVMLLVSELVTNSAIHARTDIVVSVFFDRERVNLTVHDDDAAPPTAREPLAGGEVGGYGLRLVDELSESWGWHEDIGGGKSVWCAVTADECDGSS